MRTTKKLLALLLTLCFCLAIPAMAAEESITFNFINKTTDQEYQGTVWDADKKTFTVNNTLELAVNGGRSDMAIIMLPDDATLVIPKGVTLTLTSSAEGLGAALYGYGDLTITGGGKLVVSGARDGINVTENLIIDGCTVEAEGTYATDSQTTGIFSRTGNITIKNSTINAIGSVAIPTSDGNLYIENSDITAIAGYYSMPIRGNMEVVDSKLILYAGYFGIMCGKIQEQDLSVGSAIFKNSEIIIECVAQNGIYTALEQKYENCILNVSTEYDVAIFSAAKDIDFINTDAAISSNDFAVLSPAKINFEKLSFVDKNVPITVPLGDYVISTFINAETYDIASTVTFKAADNSKLPKFEDAPVENEKPAEEEKPTNPFTDVKESDYFYDAVLWAKETGVTTGATATTFAPNNTCTRGQVVTFLWRALGCPEPTTTENPFTDVKESDYFYKAVLWAKETGVTTGTSATAFSPNATCTSGQVITFLWRSNGKPAAEHEGTEYYAEAAAWAEANGLLAGTAVEFAPNNLSPRADIVTYLYRNAMNQDK